MAQYVEGPKRAFPAGGAIAQYARVKLVAGQLAVCGEGDVDLGVIETQAFAAGEMHAVRLRTAQGTAKMVASGAVAAGVNVYGDAAGEVTATPNTNLVGLALSAATGAGSVLEVERLDGALRGQAVVEAHTAAYAATTADTGKTFTNKGAAGEVDFTLPVAAAGLKFRFSVLAAQIVHVLPGNGTDQIGTPSTATVPATGVPNTAGHGVSATAIGATLELECDEPGLWSVISSAGAWTLL